jgi:putative ABC transport system ATP-binding protein
MIEFEHVTKIFGRGATAFRAVCGLSFSCGRGTFSAIMGPSGSGKSTVLHLLAGLTAVTEGRVIVDGSVVGTMEERELAALRRQRIGYVMQSANLLPYLSVEQNVAVPLMLAGIAPRERRERARQALRRAQIEHRAAHWPSHLSGGEQQRVAIARAIVMNPPIILADEPTGNLDQDGGHAVMDLIQDLNEELGVTVLMVTHDPVFASCAQRILRIVDGRLAQEQHLDRSPGRRQQG